MTHASLLSADTRIDEPGLMSLEVMADGTPFIMVTDRMTGKTASIAIDRETGPRLLMLIETAVDLLDRAVVE